MLNIVSTVQRLALLPAFFFILLSLAIASAPGGIVISPVRVMIFPDKNSASTKVTNDTGRPIIFQVDTLLWQQTDTEDLLSPTAEIMAVPPVFTLPPGGSQTVRLAIRRPADRERELTYRIYITEVPDETRKHEGIRTKLRFSIPIFVAPKKRKFFPDSWLARMTGERTLQLTYTNTGNAHVLFSKIRLFDGEGPAISEIEPAAYVLAGRSRTWAVKLDKPAAASALTLKVDSDYGAHEVRLPLGSP